jgi:hypothetical protein
MLPKTDVVATNVPNWQTFSSAFISSTLIFRLNPKRNSTLRASCIHIPSLRSLTPILRHIRRVSFTRIYSAFLPRRMWPSALNWVSRSTCAIAIGPDRSLTQAGAVTSCGVSWIACSAPFRCESTASIAQCLHLFSHTPTHARARTHIETHTHLLAQCAAHLVERSRDPFGLQPVSLCDREGCPVWVLLGTVL